MRKRKLFERIHLRFELDRAYFREALAYVPRPLYSRHLLMFLGSTVLAALTVWLTLAHQPREIAFMSGIFVLAALLWVTEALPLFATALVVIGLEIILLANPGSWSGFGFANGMNPNYKDILSPFSDPILILFLGGFILARAAVKEGVDRALASSVLRIFGQKPIMVTLGLMLITATFSMFMSNTATTAMMITLVSPLLVNIPTEDPFRKGLLLCIPFAANIGGMGTPIGSPPNAVAIGFLRNAGQPVGFLDWMLIGVPLALLLLLLAWLVLNRIYRSPAKDLQLQAHAEKIKPRGWFVVAVFCVTILLWLTDQWHGLPTAVTALLPVILFTATNIIDRKDYNNLEWHILALIAGGIALGLGMQLSGLDKVLISLIPGGSGLIFLMLIVATVLLSIFMSNTAAANLIIPLGITLAAAAPEGSGSQMVIYGVSIALASSVAMALPISTPPNAIAYAKGIIETRDFVKVGGFLSLMAIILIGIFGSGMVSFWLSLMGNGS